MKLALIGYGKMGKNIHHLAETQGIEVAHICDKHEDIIQRDFDSNTIAIDFTEPNAVLGNLKTLAKKNTSVVIGTTGWTEHLSAAEEIVNKSGIAMLHGSNFSIGVHLFWHILDHASTMMNDAKSYDISIHEEHHNQKKDSPSGTALSTADIIVKNIDRKTAIGTNHHSPSSQETLHISALRCGNIPGTHTVKFESAVDGIELTHKAHNRDGFAAGAIKCSQWLKGKQGIFTVEDYFQDTFIHML